MSALVRAIACGSAVVAAVVLAGCGGAGLVGVANEGRVGEFAGDGHNGVKALLEFAALAPAQMATQALPSALVIGEAPLTGRTPARSINWYRVPPVSSSRRLLVTLQPTADEDTDLYLLSADGEAYRPEAACLGYSNRLPSGGDDVDGYAPDWVAFDTGATAGRQAAQVAVCGVATGATPKHYRLECDPVWGLTVNGTSKSGSLAEHDSRWYQFTGQIGKDYRIIVGTSGGDPDTYAYQGDAKHFVAKHTVTGGGTVYLTAAANGTYFVRLYGFRAGPYTVRVASP